MTDANVPTPDAPAVAIPDDGLLPPLPANASNLLPEAIDVPGTVGTIEQALGIKPGSRTSEFWISLVVGLANTAAAVALLCVHKITPEMATTMLTGGTGALAVVYTIGRSYLKGKALAPVPPGTTVVQQ